MIKNMSNAIIDIPLRQDFYDQNPVFEVEIKQDGKTIYHNKTYALVMNLVQSITTLDPETLELEGDSQILTVGHPIIQFFAEDQLRKKMIKSGVIEQAVRLMSQALPNDPRLKEELAKIAKRNSYKK